VLVESGHDSWFMNFSDNGDRNAGIAQEDKWNETEKWWQKSTMIM